MNILLATSCAVPSGGGIASYNQELVHLLGSKHKIFLITASDERNVEGYFQTLSVYNKNWHNYDFAKSILDRIKEWNIDIIINSDSTLLALLAPYINVPIVSVSHFVNGKIALNAGYNSQYLSRIISLSKYGKVYLEKTFNITDPDKVKVIYNFVAAKNLPLPAHKLKNDPITIVYPGGTSIQKSVDIVMRTLFRLLKSNLNFRFIWLGQTNLPAGSISPHKDTTQFFPKDCRLEIKGKVSREDSIRYLEDANIFLLPSRGEGCPITLLESMRAGCIPVISDARHGSRDILEMGKFGAIVKQDCSKDLFEKLKDIILHHDKYSQDYFSTQNFSKRCLSQEVWNEQMNKILNEALAIPKRTKQLSEKDFINNVRGYEKLIKKYRFKEIIQSIKCRVYLEYIYIFCR